MPGTLAVPPCKSIKPLAVIAPASSLPQDVEEVFIVMDVSARMFPWNTANVPMVAELPTCQKTLEAFAPPIRTIVRRWSRPWRICRRRAAEWHWMAENWS